MIESVKMFYDELGLSWQTAKSPLSSGTHWVNGIKELLLLGTRGAGFD